MKRRRSIGIAFLCAAAGGAFSAAVFFPRPLEAGRFNPYAKLSVFSKALSYIESNYVEDITEIDLMYGAARGLTEVLDPHSKFMDPEEYAKLKRETEGSESIVGIGIDVEKQRRSGRLVVVSPIEGSPAARAGIQPGDVIKRINQVEGAALSSIEDALREIQGPPGSEVELVIERHGKDLVLRLLREKFDVKPVEAKMLADNTGYIKIRFFSATTEPLLEEALARFGTKEGGGPMSGLVLDVRRNPGGLLDQGVKVSDLFLDKGVIVTTKGKGGKVLEEARAHSKGSHTSFPMVVLVDGGSASAAEIVAGALQDQRRAVVLGTRTFGKGSVQTVIDLDGCGPKPCGLKITIARYYTPNGRSIQGLGILPDIVVPATAPSSTLADDESFRETHYKKRLANEQGESGAERRTFDDYQLQVALDTLRILAKFSGGTPRS